MKKFIYKNENERLGVIVKLNNIGRENIHNKKEKTYYVCDENEKIVNGEIIVNTNYLQEIKDNKIKELKSYCQEVIYDKYSREKQMDIALQVNSTTADKNEMKTFIKSNIDKCANLEEKINELDEDGVKSFDVKEEWKKEE